MKVFNLADNWYGWDFFNLILIMEEFVINWLDLNENGRLRPTGLVLMKRGVDDQLAWSWRKEISMNNWLGLDERKCLRSTGLILTKRHLDKKKCLWPTGLVLTKGMSTINWLDLGERVSMINWLDLHKRVSDLTKRSVYDQLAWSWQKGAFVTNWLGLDKKERLWPTGLVLTKGTSTINWLDLDKKECL